VRYRKKPEIIEAIQYTGDNEQDVAHFIGQLTFLPHYRNGEQLMIPIGGGVMILHLGVWVIREPDGTFNLMNDTVFTDRYEEDQ
jgi:hypothetical protein